MTLTDYLHSDNKKLVTTDATRLMKESNAFFTFTDSAGDTQFTWTDSFLANLSIAFATDNTAMLSRKELAVFNKFIELGSSGDGEEQVLQLDRYLATIVESKQVKED